MLLGGPYDIPFLTYFVQYLHPLGFFLFSLLLSHPMFVRLCALHGVALFLQTGGDGNRDVEEDGERQMCLHSFLFVYDALSWVSDPLYLWLCQR